MNTVPPEETHLIDDNTPISPLFHVFEPLIVQLEALCFTIGTNSQHYCGIQNTRTCQIHDYELEGQELPLVSLFQCKYH